MFSSSNSEDVWKTVDVLYMGSEPYAYQQKHEVRDEEVSDYKTKKGYGSDGGVGVGFGVGLSITVVPTDEHRLKKMKDTLNEDSIKEAVEVMHNDN